MQRVKARAPASFKQQVLETEKRLNILFDHLNNEDLLKPNTIAEMNELAQALQARQYEQAQALFTDIMTTKTDEGSNWMVSILRIPLEPLDLLWIGGCEAAASHEPCNSSLGVRMSGHRINHRISGHRTTCVM